jgi:hypothetical protein
MSERNPHENPGPLFRALTNAMGRPELADDPRFLKQHRALGERTGAGGAHHGMDVAVDRGATAGAASCHRRAFSESRARVGRDRKPAACSSRADSRHAARQGGHRADAGILSTVRRIAHAPQPSATDARSAYRRGPVGVARARAGADRRVTGQPCRLACASAALFINALSHRRGPERGASRTTLLGQAPTAPSGGACHAECAARARVQKGQKITPRLLSRGGVVRRRRGGVGCSRRDVPRGAAATRQERPLRQACPSLNDAP